MSSWLLSLQVKVVTKSLKTASKRNKFFSVTFRFKPIPRLCTKNFTGRRLEIINIYLSVRPVRAWSSSVLHNNRKKWGPQLAMKGRSRTSIGYFHSKSENRPWLRVQIPVMKLAGVGIINRKDCCGNRLKNVEIRAGMRPNLSNRIVAVFRGPGRTGHTHVVRFRPHVVAKYITFQLRGRGILQINGIKLYRAGASRRKTTLYRFTCLLLLVQNSEVR